MRNSEQSTKHSQLAHQILESKQTNNDINIPFPAYQLLALLKSKLLHHLPMYRIPDHVVSNILYRFLFSLKRQIQFLVLCFVGDHPVKQARTEYYMSDLDRTVRRPKLISLADLLQHIGS